MAVKVNSVVKSSSADRCGIKAGDTLLTLNGHEIVDVLDYRFYQLEREVTVEFISEGEKKTAVARKPEYDELGMEFDSYLMDKEHSCRNKCIFCFIDQMPKGMRETLYFKDDDSRLSFLFGNYITLTNLSEHEIERIMPDLQFCRAESADIASFPSDAATVKAINCFLYMPSHSRRTSCLCAF